MMAYGLRDTRLRRRRQRRRKLILALLVLAGLGGAGWTVYRAGGEQARQDIALLERNVARLVDENAELARQAQELKSALADANGRAEEWRQRYRTDVATGERKDLLDLVTAKLDAGIPATRLKELIGAASVRGDCEPQPEVKRLVPRVAGQGAGGGNIASSFFDRAVVVMVDGQPAASGRYSPYKPVKVHFSVVGGDVSEADGTLPLDHVFVYGDKEYRFSLARDAVDGWIQVTGDRCSLKQH